MAISFGNAWRLHRRKSAFPSSAVQVATAVPAFVGYTEKAFKNNKSISISPRELLRSVSITNFLRCLEDDIHNCCR